MAALNRLNDYLFKWIFGREERKAILLDLLNAILTNGSEKDVIVDFEYQNRELDPRKVNDKRATLDILAKTSEGVFINIEIQVENNFDIDHRMLYYWAKNFSMQLLAGADYSELKDTIGICIMNFNYFERESYHSCYKVLETTDYTPLNNDMRLHFIELKKWAVLKKKPGNRLERWLLYFANSNPKDLEKAASENKYIAEAIVAEVNFGLDSEDRYWYDMREKFLMDQGSIAAKLARLSKLEERATETEKRLTTTKAQLTTAKSQLTTAKAQLTTAKARLTTTEERLTTTKAELANIKAEVDSAKSEAEKYKRLYEEMLKKK